MDQLLVTNQNGGVWQVTSQDLLPASCSMDGTGCNAGTLKHNICCQADYVNTHFYTTYSWGITSMGIFNSNYGTCAKNTLKKINTYETKCSGWPGRGKYTLKHPAPPWIGGDSCP